ncbi:MAG: SEL1-like repeat protein [Pseudomonadota bacterium]
MNLNNKCFGFLAGITALMMAGTAAAQECIPTDYVSAPAVEADSAVLKCDFASGRRYSQDTRGKGVAHREIDVADALPACKEAVDLYPDSPRLQYQLGRVLGKAEAERASVKWIRKAADANYPPAMVVLANLYHNGNAVPRNQGRAQELFESAACAGDAWAMYYLGSRYQFGRHVKKDMNLAVDWYEKSAAAGVDEAQYYLGDILVRGKGVDADVTRGLQLLRQSAEQGHIRALHYYGWLQGAGYYGIPENKAESNKWYELAAHQGLASSQGNLGQNYRFGSGVRRDNEKAAYWSRHAAYHASGWGLYKAADLYREGIGVERDPEKAKQLYLKAADYYQKGADNGTANSQYWLGTLYEDGYGLDKDRNKAIALYQQAAKDQHQHAIKRLEELGIPLENE